MGMFKGRIHPLNIFPRLERAKGVLSVSNENKRRILPQGRVYVEATGSEAQGQQKGQELKVFSTLPGLRFPALHQLNP